MLNRFVVAILLSLVCNTLALGSYDSPVLVFKHKENAKPYASGFISTTTEVKTREFEQRLQALDQKQKIMFFVAPDLCPEDLALKDEAHAKAFQNIANDVDIVDYMLFVENAVNNKVTQGHDVARTEVSTTNELEEEPSSDKRIIIVKLPGYHVSEEKLHWLRRIDRAIFAVSQLPQYRDYLFILTAEKNSRLEQHSRKRRAADTPTPKTYADANVLVYFKDFLEVSKKTGQADKSVETGAITSKKDGNTISVEIPSTSDYKLSFKFDYDPSQEYWYLNTVTSTIGTTALDGKLATHIGAPLDNSFCCSSGVWFNVENKNNPDIVGVFFKELQIQPNFNSTEKMTKFGDAYDCVGFVSSAIWSGLFITFLLLGIVAFGITYIMDIRTMDRFDDPKGKTITVTAND